MKTHKVIDLAYTEEEQDCFNGTHQECIEFLAEQNSYGDCVTLKIVSLTKKEIIIYNEHRVRKHKYSADK